MTADVLPQVSDPLAATARLAARGDREAMDRLLRRVLPRVRNLVRYLLRGDRDVDDVAQRGLAQLARKLSSWSGAGAFTSWLDRVVVRETFAEIRRRGADAERGIPASLDSLPATADANKLDEYLARREMVRMLDIVSADQRTALVLRYVLELSVPEIARETEVSPETVRSRLRLGKARLRQLGAGGFSDEGVP